MRFVPYPELGDRPNVIVDGAANEATILTLSHWPKSGTDRALMADTSAEIVFRFLDSKRSAGADIASNDHFDEDGLIGLFTLTRPNEASAARELLLDAARAGDFGTYRLRDAARLAFTISALADPETSPLDPKIFQLAYPLRAAALYGELLARLPDLVHVDRHEAMWREEDASLAASEAAIARGDVIIEEDAAIDLAIVRIAPARKARVHRFTGAQRAAIHPMAIHNATERLRVLLMEDRGYELQLRYETWVQYASRRPLPRPDLTALAARLNEEEGAAAWTFDGVDRITPRLRSDASSAIDPERLVSLVRSFLREAPPAWDPYD